MARSYEKYEHLTILYEKGKEVHCPYCGTLKLLKRSTLDKLDFGDSQLECRVCRRLFTLHPGFIKKTHMSSIDEKNAKAMELGMSYGKYVGMLYAEQIRGGKDDGGKKQIS